MVVPSVLVMTTVCAVLKLLLVKVREVAARLARVELDVSFTSTDALGLLSSTTDSVTVSPPDRASVLDMVMVRPATSSSTITTDTSGMAMPWYCVVELAAVAETENVLDTPESTLFGRALTSTAWGTFQLAVVNTKSQQLLMMNNADAVGATVMVTSLTGSETSTRV